MGFGSLKTQESIIIVVPLFSYSSMKKRRKIALIFDIEK